MIFQDYNFLQDPSTGLQCWYNTGFVWIKGEVLVLVNTLYCFTELAKVWFPPSPLPGCISNSCISRWRFVYNIFKLTNTITIKTSIEPRDQNKSSINNLRDRAFPGNYILYSIIWWCFVITRNIKYLITHWFLSYKHGLYMMFHRSVEVLSPV